MGINQVLSLVYRSKAKEGRTHLLNANNLPRKDPAVGINGFEGVRPEWLLPKRGPCYVLEESRIWRGREGKPTYWCMPPELSLLFPQFPLFFSLFSFLSFFFSFTLLFFFYSVNTLFFGPLFRARQGPFYSACRDQSFTILPLNRFCLVWAYLPTTKGVWHLPSLDKGRFVSFLSLP